MTGREIAEAFLRFFEERGHARVASSPLIPGDDPTLLFANAGMNQFKDIILGGVQKPYTRVASTQKCIRAGGKHNDLEEVGHDARHLTFFEMLGNWSFGDYYKRGAIEMAWEFVTEILRLPPDKLWITIYATDEESHDVWRDVIGVPEGRIRRYGNIEVGDDENFWAMGETGPCGPDSEIFIDTGEGEGDFDPDSDRYLELWNLVFMEFDRAVDGTLNPLPERHVDTGMGLERITRVLQDAPTVFETDLFRPIIAALEEVTGEPASESPHLGSYRVIADHARALVMAIADGVALSNEGRGYVLRRILRRAARHGRVLGIREAFVYRLVAPITDLMSDVYPEVRERADHAALVIRSEEGRFGETLDAGLGHFDRTVERVREAGLTIIPGTDAFRLHDTYGFPLDLTVTMADEIHLTVDTEEFEREMVQQRERARRAARFTAEEAVAGDWVDRLDAVQTRFIGYTDLEADAGIVRYRLGEEGKTVEVATDVTPFYAEAGGQVSDGGIIAGPDFVLDVEDVTDRGALRVHRARLAEGELGGTMPNRVHLAVDAPKRRATERNHTATHLLHAALRQTLGDHARQSGSLVAPDRLRFDFSHFAAAAPEELEAIEDRINAWTRENHPVAWQEMDFADAQALGAMALFGEKYGDRVRVVRIGDFSVELCGGTHVRATGEIGGARLAGESSVSAGVRRVEVQTGEALEEALRRERALLAELTRLLASPPETLPGRVEALLDRVDALEKELGELRAAGVADAVRRAANDAIEINGFKLVRAIVQAKDAAELRRAADVARAAVGTGVGVLAAPMGQHATLLVFVTEDLTKTRRLKAGDLIKAIGPIMAARGGGRPALAQAGGGNPALIDRAFAEAERILREQMR